MFCQKSAIFFILYAILRKVYRNMQKNATEICIYAYFFVPLHMQIVNR